MNFVLVGFVTTYSEVQNLAVGLLGFYLFIFSLKKNTPSVFKYFHR